MTLLGMTLLKSFAMLVGRGEAAPPAKRERRNRVIHGKPGQVGSSGEPVIGDRTESVAAAAISQAAGELRSLPEARYAYYRRCQQFRRNGEQCKAPAMKGEGICHRHAEQQDTERRRQQQRRELLSQPGCGLCSFRAIQRTIGMVAQALLDDRIDAKVAGRLMMEIQSAIRLKTALAAEARRRGELPTSARMPARSSTQPRQTVSLSRPRKHLREAESVAEMAPRSWFSRVALATQDAENQWLTAKSTKEAGANSQQPRADVMIV